MSFLVASTGVDPDAYFSVLEEEIESGVFEKYKPHQTSWTMNGSNSDNAKKPETDNPTENTIKSRESGGNLNPSPSDNK